MAKAEIWAEVSKVWDREPMKRPQALLEAFSVDLKDNFAVAWLALVAATAAGIPQPEMVAELCAQAHMPRQALYQRMKKALAPIFEAEPETLKAFGIKPCSSATALARGVAQIMKGGRPEADGKV